MPKPKKPDPDHNLYRRGETWWCRYVLAGIEQRVSLRTTDVKAARRARDRLLRDAAAQREGRGPEPIHKWEDAVEAYLAIQETLVRSGSLSARTAARYETSLIQLSETLEGTVLTEITTATVLDFVIARREDDLSSSTIRNDLTAWSRVLSVAATLGWIEINPARNFDRKTYIGRDADLLNPPVDAEVQALFEEVATWSEDIADLIRWLRETGMRLAEGLAIERGDIHPDGRHATLRRGVKRNSHGLKTRTIDLGRAADMLPRLPLRGRLFPSLSLDSAVVSTRYGQWRRQRQGRENREAAAQGRAPVELARFRLHDLRHAFAIASLTDDPTCIYRLMEHLGHSSVRTTEVYTRFLRGEGAQRRYTRDPNLFGSLPPLADIMLQRRA
ncbi:tyrosine-type recombinase/integrase [Siccirubricoccus sp. G192]|uniref:tyrosine-type recombinase/integrase n=1 Tax=Siccirubricoccus sp. G192 TaxID=2849651 RepID=UPI001C2BCA03|nr:tyrosine-type recombinase/integrase [Siccirubricoccus sp. G192]MBV1798724.1 tyrosine-type recombinase/integrase [Siccirubricoccus sp. G192]